MLGRFFSVSFRRNDAKTVATNTNESVKINSMGVNVFKVRGFANKKTLKKHADKHLKEYPGLTAEQYEKRALELLEKPVGNGVLGYMDKAGKIVRYDTVANDLASGYPDKGVSTMYKPIKGQELYESERRRNQKDEQRA